MRWSWVQTSCSELHTTCVISGAERRELCPFALRRTTPTSSVSEVAVTSTNMFPASTLVERYSIPISRLGPRVCILGNFPGRFLHSQAANFATDWKTPCFTSKPLALRPSSAPWHSQTIFVSIVLEARWEAKGFQRLSIMHQICLSFRVGTTLSSLLC